MTASGFGVTLNFGPVTASIAVLVSNRIARRTSMVSLKDYRCGAAAAVSDLQRARQFYEGVLGLVPGIMPRP